MDQLSLCPSFNSYSKSSHDAVSRAHRDSDLDFEFPPLSDLDSLAFPVFNLDLLSDRRREAPDEEERSILVPLSKLFLEQDRDRDRDPSSSSSSEADELESVEAGTYCVWAPKPSPLRCEKSSSTGSSATEKPSRRWRIRDLLLRRSNSEGSGKDSAAMVLKVKAKDKDKEEVKKKKGSENVSAHEKFYVRNRKLKEEDKIRRRSYLPYRQGLVGFFAHNHTNGSGMGTTTTSTATARTFPPF